MCGHGPNHQTDCAPAYDCKYVGMQSTLRLPAANPNGNQADEQEIEHAGPRGKTRRHADTHPDSDRALRQKKPGRAPIWAKGPPQHGSIPAFPRRLKMGQHEVAANQRRRKCKTRLCHPTDPCPFIFALAHCLRTHCRIATWNDENLHLHVARSGRHDQPNVAGSAKPPFAGAAISMGSACNVHLEYSVCARQAPSHWACRRRCRYMSSPP
ncbi:hypothetical protein PG994_011888 [Apiospora phragmitis]|uniref:C2H2-type domain-containing protein n=1 Tax=Apiospora phragmitis TaxID=2905665 RepID=A0ABR1TU65_9PEZI